MKETREINRIGWVAALVLGMGLAAPALADDQVVQDWTGGQTAPAPAPVENQVPADFQTGVFDMSGNRLGANMEEVQAKEQARLEAFQATHPDPGDGRGIRDMQGRFLGANVREAAETGNIQLGDPLDAVDPARLRELHGADKVYVDPQTGMATVYATQDGRVVSKEEWADYMRGIGSKQKADGRKWVDEAIGAERASQNGDHDGRVDGVVNGTLTEQRKFERMIDDGQAVIDAEVKRSVPLRTLRSLESNGGDQR